MKHKHAVSIPRLSFLYFLIMALSMPLLAQVTIKEKVTLNAHGERFVQSTCDSLRFEFSWQSANAGRIVLDDGTQIFGSSTPIVMKLGASPQATYHLSLQLCSGYEGTIKVFGPDGTLLQNLTNTFCGYCDCYSVWNFYFHYDPGYNYNGLSVSMAEDSVFHIGINTVMFNPSYDNCSGIEPWNSSADSITLSIVSGSEFGSFYSTSGQSLGTSVTRLLSGFSSIKYRADGTNPYDSGVVTIRASVKSNVSEAIFVVIHRTLHIVSGLSGEPLPYGSGEGFWIEVFDEDDQYVTLPYDILLTSQIIQGKEYASLTTDLQNEEACGGEDSVGGVLSGASFLAILTSDEEPQVSEEVIVRVTPSDSTILPLDMQFNVTPGYSVITPTQSVLTYGDTIQLDLKIRRPNGDIVPVPEGTSVGLFLVCGINAGYLSTMDGSQQDDFIGDTIPQARFIATEEQPQSDVVTVYIVAQIFDDDAPDDPSGLLKLTVVKNLLDHFEVSLHPDTLSNREIATMTVIAKNPSGIEVPIDSSTLMNLDVEDGGQFVDFITETGDTLTSDELSNVPYSTLRAGNIKIVARGSTSTPPAVAHPLTNGSDGATDNERQNTNYAKGRRRTIMQSHDYPFSTLRVVMAQDATKHGTGKIILKPEIKVFTAKSEIKPYYPQNIGTSQSRTEVKVAVTVSGLLWQDYGVILSTSPVEYSGGHDHPNRVIVGGDTVNRPTGKFLESGNNILDTTSTNDTLRIRFQASPFGGLEKITATLDLTKPLAAVAIETVRVPGLVELEPGEHYVLVGASGDLDPCPHNVTSQHTQNHFGKNDLILDIQQIATEYNSQYSGILLRVNDMSLEKGGVFDIMNNWIPDSGHSEHRLGTNADIGFKGVNQAISCVDLDLTYLKELIDDYTKGPTVTHGGSQPHYHIRD